MASVGQRKTSRVLPGKDTGKGKCPKCRESIPRSSTRCIFCDAAVNFDQVESQRSQRKRDTYRKIIDAENARVARDSLYTGIIVDLFAIVIFVLSIVGLIWASEEVPLTTGAAGLFLGTIGLIYGTRSILRAVSKR